MTKKFLLINDTQNSVNPGCKMVHRAIHSLFDGQEGRGCIQDSIPLNYWADSFEAIAVKPRDCVKCSNDYFPCGTVKAPRVSFRKWKKIADSNEIQDSGFIERLHACDAVIVNGEGSIHHNFKRALAILALIQTSLSCQREVFLLNATVQAMAPRISKTILPSLTFIHTRDPRTFSELQQYMPNCHCAPDLAFLAATQASVKVTDSCTPLPENCLVTGGVITNAEVLSILFDTVIQNGLVPVYLCVGDGGEQKVASCVCKDRGIEMVNAWDIPLDDFISFLARFPIAISGRHHINIFLLRASVPFVPIPSNTWKIEEALSLIDYPIRVTHRKSELPSVFEKTLRYRESLIPECVKSFERGIKQIEKLKDGLVQCMY